MDKFFKRHEHWDEFQWEREIRKDEMRISGYFRELPTCLDLPAEEELINAQLTANQDFSSGIAIQLGFADDEADDEAEYGSREKEFHSHLVETLDVLATDWNLLYASKLHNELLPQGLGTACAYAKLLARTSDFAEPQQDCSPELLLSIGKRCLSDLNALAGRLKALGNTQLDIAGEINEHLTMLAEIRDQLISMLDELRGLKN